MTEDDNPSFASRRNDVSHIVIQLRSTVENQQRRILQLENQLDHCREQLEGETLKNGMLELELDSHKDALMEKSQQLKEQADKMDAQDCLLGLSWVDEQDIAQGDIGRLRNAIHRVLTSSQEAETRPTKKRKLTP